MSIKSRVATGLATLLMILCLSHQAGARETPIARTIQDPALEWGPCPSVFPAGPAGAPHTGECLSKEPCVLFIAFEGPVDVQTKPEWN